MRTKTNKTMLPLTTILFNLIHSNIKSAIRCEFTVFPTDKSGEHIDEDGKHIDVELLIRKNLMSPEGIEILTKTRHQEDSRRLKEIPFDKLELNKNIIISRWTETLDRWLNEVIKNNIIMLGDLSVVEYQTNIKINKFLG